MSKDYTLEELQQLLRMAEQREKEKKAKAPKEVREGNLVDYLDGKGRAHAALVLKVKANGVLQLKVFHQAQPNEVVEANASRWRKR